MAKRRYGLSQDTDRNDRRGLLDEAPLARVAERLPVARELGETSLCFLCQPTLSDEADERTIEVATDVVQHATR